MAPKVFVLGSTGYIGGDALFAIVQSHPGLEITCLVRNSDKRAQVASQFASVSLVYGNLDSVDLIEAEANKADIVLNFANADHEAAVSAIVKGLAAQSPDHIGYFIHTSGDSILKYPDIERDVFGEASTKVFDDWNGIEKIRSFPDFAPHRPVEKIIFAASESHKSIRTAIVCPPTIYGEGRGPGNQQSIQVPALVRIALERKGAIHVGRGEAYLTTVHVSDLSDLYLKLFDAASAGGGSASWDENGYYFANAEELHWGDVSKSIALEALKLDLIPSAEVVSISTKEANEMMKMGAELLGGNSRQRAIRARKLLGWTPRGQPLLEGIEELVTMEARKLGLTQGHAEKVSR